ncbi:MAG: hypothetical protein ACXV7J_07635 [Methylomonas sp.]
MKVQLPVILPEAAGSKNVQIGEHLIDTAAWVSTEEGCAETPETPWADFEQQRIDPQTVSAGEKFNHQLVYVVCDSDPEHIIEGTLYRNIYHNGYLLHREPKPVYLKPGRWTINALIGVPAKSKPGTYTLKTEFIGKTVGKQKTRLSKQIDFEVQD